MSEVTSKAIAIEYNLYRDTATGELIESTEGKEPLAFLSGLGQMIPEFEANVADLKEGDTFSFGIKSENAYGSRKDEAVIELAQDMFMDEGKLKSEVEVDNILPLEDQNGNVIPGKIISINKETITVDVNHLLADQDLFFTGKIIEMRDATTEEVEHGHVHGAHGHQH
ncbi:MAG: FKBP-type peptidyl-prolyl cis-trans isomerase [Flavobacteriaceae bacterium]|nr:FKBP-type peptidyl-prolyl cis-trans isomerase [Flavobacteriaceae bacterium]